MATIKLPRKERLIQLLTYDPQSGKLHWKARDRSEFANARSWATWNAQNADKPAFETVGRNGYHRGTLEGISVQAHRVIWKLMTGVDADQVDHINGVRTDNTWVNLRSVTAKQNRKNVALLSSNKTGVHGVMLYKRWPGSKPVYWVRIGTKTLGYFEDLDEAIQVRKTAEIQRDYHPNHGRAQRVPSSIGG